MKSNKYRMWPDGPTIELPAKYHWDAAAERPPNHQKTKPK